MYMERKNKRMKMKVRITETAFKLFLKKGFAYVCLNGITRESDIATGLFHQYLTSRYNPLVEVINRYIFNCFSSTMETFMVRSTHVDRNQHLP